MIYTLGSAAILFTGSRKMAIKTRGPEVYTPEIFDNKIRTRETIPSSQNLTVMTLNIAHGRSRRFHQATTGSRKIKGNLQQIAQVLQREKPHLVALQEADGPSFWSGKFDHIHYLTQVSSYQYAVRGNHVMSKHLNYGTAILSQLPIHEATSYSFPPTPPIPAKGFVMTQVELPGTTKKIDIVSIHLDFARQKTRMAQAQVMIDKLRSRDNLLIIMGDFNTTWEDEQTLQHITKSLNLKPYEPHKPTSTFTKHKKRIDWIFISTGLTFQRHEVLSDKVSDHFAVIAEISYLDALP